LDPDMKVRKKGKSRLNWVSNASKKIKTGRKSFRETDARAFSADLGEGGKENLKKIRPPKNGSSATRQTNVIMCVNREA